MLRLFLVLVVIVPATLRYGLPMIWAVMRGSDRTDGICDASPRGWSKLLLRFAGVDVVLENEEAIDPARPQILVANHVSWFDVLALAASLPGRYLFVAKEELARVPVFGRAVAACGHVFIDRKDRGRAVESLARARSLLENQHPTIIMFPEGTRSSDGLLQPFKKGAFVLAIQTGVDIVPAAIFGSRDVMRKNSLWIRPGTIRVRFGEPIGVTGLGMDDRDELTARGHGAVAGLQDVGHE